MGKLEDDLDKPDKPVDLNVMHSTKSALDEVNLRAKVCFMLRKAVRVPFNGGSYKGHTISGFITLDVDGMEIVWAGWY